MFKFTCLSFALFATIAGALPQGDENTTTFEVTVTPTTTSELTVTTVTPTTTTPASSPTPPASSCARLYTVQSGDTCNAISIAQGVSTFQLAFVNPVINSGCTNLFVNQVLCLGITGEDCTTVHEVVTGDFCAAIADSAGIPLATLLANNPNVDSGCTNIGLEGVLCTADEVINYTQTFTPPAR